MTDHDRRTQYAILPKIWMMEAQVKKIARQIIGYGMVGLVGTLAHYTVLAMGVEFDLMSPTAATSLGFVVGAVINHILNHIWVFKSKQMLRQTAFQFYGVALGGFFLNLGVFYTLSEIAGLQYLISQVIATGAVFLSTFMLNRIWTFART
ncbi:GtrA family protein [Desulfococcus sp.]|uniref:GtrA family protein n=1 Tax=Desulfococcus sp. TaxID=2025834 RepID=UPI0035938A32